MPQPRRASPGAQRTASAGTRTPPQQQPHTIGAATALVVAMNAPSQQLLLGSAAIQAAVTYGLAKAAGKAAVGTVTGATRRDLGDHAKRALVSGVVLGHRQQSIRRRRVLPAYIEDIFRRARPSASPEEVRLAVREELEREMQFRRRQLARIYRDLHRGLGKRTPHQRHRAVVGVIERERYYSALREEAAAGRAAGAADALNVKEAEPIAPIWQLGPRATHTPDCVILHGHAIPWEVLEGERLIPPVHNGCGCRLRPRREAWLMGITPTIREPLSIEVARELVARARAAAHEPPHGVLLGGAHVR